ncbi:MAG: 16S rRNA (cytosine(1402)-N(4))-methyltransferase RsmH [Erysipelotrichaceae bacterium]|nr:16S rRNA (cytosine(1402)-N(4))-methyltransferase RsmH [Erysipelotrichaceae bacterium]
MIHKSVLLDEVIDNLAIKENGIYIDGTLGRAGHAKAILSHLKNGHLYGFDKDQQAINESQIILSDISSNFTLINSDFKDMSTVMNKMGINQVDGILLDLGVSSPQFDDPSRGFSYRYDAYLDMRMDQNQALSAYEVVNTYQPKKLLEILYEYGEEKFAKNIVRKIVNSRAIKEIKTTFELVEIIKDSLPAKELNKKGHPAKKTFQALRIEVNQELESLKQGLVSAIDLLARDGRLCVISFHSLEDRIVKNMFKDLIEVDKLDKRIPILPKDIKTSEFELISKKPIVASKIECLENNRAHSAKLRVLHRL